MDQTYQRELETMWIISVLTSAPHATINATKYHFFLSPYQSATINIDGSIIDISNSQQLSGITGDSKLTFEEHINSPSRKSGQKLHTFKI